MINEMGANEEHEYILGTHGKELRRLNFQHQVWAEQTAGAWSDAGFGPGDRLLDVGCGPGYAAFDLANLVGATGEVLAVDVSQRFLDHLQAQIRARGISNIRCELKDVERLELPERSVDGAFARWVLCFTPDPSAVVAGVAHALQPGGCFAVLDYCHYQAFTVAPRSEAIDRVIHATAESFRIRGGNPDIGRELPGLMSRRGLEVRTIRPVVRVGRPGTALWQWPQSFFANYLPTLVEMQLITHAEASAFQAAWRARSEEAGAFFLTPPMVQVVGVKR
jgi:SAM-dependent methyltransferase